MKISLLQLLIIVITSLKVEALSALEMKQFTSQDMHLEDIFINSQASDMFNLKIQPKLNQQLWINQMKLS
jgi:hypothetical protein